MSETAENVTQFANVESTEVETEEKPAIPEQVIEAFKAGKEADRDEEKILIDMLQAGAPFKKVRKYYNELMLDFGLAISDEDKGAILENVFSGVDVTTEEGFDKAVSEVNSAIDFINERGAAQMVRGFARKLKIDFFRKPKPESAGIRVAFTNNFYNALVDNPTMNEEEVRQYIVENGSDATLKSEKSYQKIARLANKIAEKYTH